MMTESMYDSRRAGGSPVTGGQGFTATEEFNGWRKRLSLGRKRLEAKNCGWIKVGVYARMTRKDCRLRNKAKRTTPLTKPNT